MSSKQSDGETPVMMEILEELSTSLFLPFPGLLCLGMVAPDSVLSMGEIELFDIRTVQIS